MDVLLCHDRLLPFCSAIQHMSAPEGTQHTFLQADIALPITSCDCQGNAMNAKILRLFPDRYVLLTSYI